MNPKLKEKTPESLAAVLPITGIVMFISVFLVPVTIGNFMMFLAAPSFIAAASVTSNPPPCSV